MLGPLPARSTAVPGFHITTQDDLPGPDGDEPYGLFVNETEYGNRRFLRTNVLSARPDLKKYTALRFRQEVMRHADAIAPGEDVVVVFMEALELEPPLRPSLDVITLLRQWTRLTGEKLSDTPACSVEISPLAPPQPPRKPQPSVQEWLVLHERGVIDGAELRQQLGIDGAAAA